MLRAKTVIFWIAGREFKRRSHGGSSGAMDYPPLYMVREGIQARDRRVRQVGH